MALIVSIIVGLLNRFDGFFLMYGLVKGHRWGHTKAPMPTKVKSPARKIGRPASGRNGKALKLYINPAIRAHGEKLAHSSKPESRSLSDLVEELIEREWARLNPSKASA